MRIGPSLSIAALLSCGGVVFAQSAQQPPQQPAADQKTAPAAAAVTFAGCVQSESTVLKRAGAAGNVGMGDEFVLTFASPSAGGSVDQKPDVEPPSAAVGTSGTAGNFGRVYRLTGDKENDLKPLVGQRVEITGSFKNKDFAADAMSSVGTSGRTGELTPENTPEITIDAIKPISGSCAPAIK